MANTFFAPADNIGALSQYQLQDEAQNLAAAASRRQDMTEMMRVNAQREAAARDQMARMYQTSAYQNVGLNDADVRRQLGLGEIGVRRDIGMGDIGVRRDIGLGEIAARNAATQAQERAATMPYNKMTAADAEKWKYIQQHPEAAMGILGFGDPRIREDMYNASQMKDQVARAAATANANLQRRGGLSSLQAEMADRMDSYGHFFSPDVNNQGLFNNFISPDADTVAKQMIQGGTIDPKFAARNAIIDARKYLDNEIQGTLKGLESFAPYLRFDPVAGQWKSMYEDRGLPPTANATGAAMASPTINSNTPVLNQPLITTNGVFPTGSPTNTLPHVYFTPRGFTTTPPVTGTNVPPRY